MSNPFDYIKDVSFNKKDIIRNSPDAEVAAKGYIPWITNKTLSYFQDTILYANEMNKYSFLPNQMQFDYFLNSINKRKRFAEQSKKVTSDDVLIIANYFGYSLKRAEDAMKFLTPQQIKEIKNKSDTGGVGK